MDLKSLLELFSIGIGDPLSKFLKQLQAVSKVNTYAMPYAGPDLAVMRVLSLAPCQVRKTGKFLMGLGNYRRFYRPLCLSHALDILVYWPYYTSGGTGALSDPPAMVHWDSS